MTREAKLEEADYKLTEMYLHELVRPTIAGEPFDEKMHNLLLEYVNMISLIIKCNENLDIDEIIKRTDTMEEIYNDFIFDEKMVADIFEEIVNFLLYLFSNIDQPKNN